MGEIFNKQLSKISSLKGYSKRKQISLDDMATAYIQHDQPLDIALHNVRKVKKVLKMKGFTQSEIEDFMLEFSYISKTQITKLYSESLYEADGTIRLEIECIPFYTDYNTTDLIISELESRPALLKALKNGTTKQGLSANHHVTSPVLLQNFYNKHKDIIND